jgi:GT2 family glycosyltransferase
LDQALIETDFVFGGALFAPSRLFREIGLFDRRFFLNYEETDWCYRARKQGIAHYVVSTATVFHRGSTSLGAEDGPLQTYFLYRNRLLFQEKHASPLQRLRGALEILGQALKLLRHGISLSWSGGLALDGSGIALLLALRDYCLRRFGDCPPIVRRLAPRHGRQRL